MHASPTPMPTFPWLQASLKKAWLPPTTPLPWRGPVPHGLDHGRKGGACPLSYRYYFVPAPCPHLPAYLPASPAAPRCTAYLRRACHTALRAREEEGQINRRRTDRRLLSLHLPLNIISNYNNRRGRKQRDATARRAARAACGQRRQHDLNTNTLHSQSPGPPEPDCNLPPPLLRLGTLFFFFFFFFLMVGKMPHVFPCCLPASSATLPPGYRLLVTYVRAR